jgi:Family of unknown function (DUF5677)
VTASRRPPSSRTQKKGLGWVPPTEEKAAEAAGELIGLVEARLPQRFYRENRWRMLGAAMVVRMADTVRSIVALTALGLDGDAMTLLRALYEQVVIYCWIASKPDDHIRRWISDAEWQQLRLHNDVVAFGQTVLTKREVEKAKKSQKLPDIAQLAEAADEHWSARIAAFRPPKGKPAKPEDILNFRGLYVAIYRIASRNTHTKPQALDPYFDFESYPNVVHLAKHVPTSYPSLVVPLYAQALLVCHHVLKWPDSELVIAINNRMYYP